MSYSGYGGHTYLNRQRIPERSDCCIKPDGEMVSTPGALPEWDAFWSRADRQEMESLMAPQAVTGHAVLGSGHIKLALYKQTDIYVVINGARIISLDPGIDSIKAENPDENGIFSRSAMLIGKDTTARVFWVITDNYYQYVELEEPDGSLWHGFSGYSVGPGFKEGEEGCSTEACEKKLASIFWEENGPGFRLPRVRQENKGELP